MATNVVVFKGRLGADAEMRETSGGKTVTKFSLGNTRTWTSNGERQQETTWIRVTAWNGVASGVIDYLVKGKEVTVIGSLAPNQYEKDGVTIREIFINAREIELGADPKGATEQAAPARKTTAPKTSRKKAANYEEYDDSEDGDDGDAPW